MMSQQTDAMSIKRAPALTLLWVLNFSMALTTDPGRGAITGSSHSLAWHWTRLQLHAYACHGLTMSYVSLQSLRY